MSKITSIKHNQEKQRVYVHIDGQYCCSIRERTWQSMGLNIGSEITCEELKENEKTIWKRMYSSTWEKEKKRIERVNQWIHKYLPQLTVVITGFGADTTEYIPEHPEEHGEPDLSLQFLDIEIIALEVTGTEQQRGIDYWIRPDKLEYAKNHVERDVWIVLHYQKPKECFIWIKTDNSKQYQYIEKNLKGAIEYYVVFNNADSEVKTSQEFYDYVLCKIKQNT